MIEAASGGRAVAAFGLESSLGIRGGALYPWVFDSVEFAREEKENPSTEITGNGGEGEGTPGDVDFSGKTKTDFTVYRFSLLAASMFGKPTVTDLGSGSGPWLGKFRPGASNRVLRSLWAYLDEGGSYSASVQLGRRAGEMSIAQDANKRMKIDASFAPATGDTISGFPISKSTNTGDFTNGSLLLGKVTTRGRRPYDANYTAGKSLYLKVTAVAAQTLTVKARFDTASGALDGTGFPATVFGAGTFVIRRPNSALAPDGFVTVILDDGTLVGAFGQNNEPYEITFGDQDLSVLDVDDIFEIPYQLAAGGVVLAPVAENRLSTFHLLRIVGGNSVKFDSGSMNLTRPFSPYNVNGRRLPDAIDETGTIGGTWKFNKRLFDRYFRQQQESVARFTIEDITRDQVPITGAIYEGIHVFVPRAGVSALKSGDVATKETLKESVTLKAYQPQSAPTPPAAVLAPTATFDASTEFPYQINVVSRVSLVALGA